MARLKLKRIGNGIYRNETYEVSISRIDSTWKVEINNKWKGDFPTKRAAVAYATNILNAQNKRRIQQWIDDHRHLID